MFNLIEHCLLNDLVILIRSPNYVDIMCIKGILPGITVFIFSNQIKTSRLHDECVQNKFPGVYVQTPKIDWSTFLGLGCKTWDIRNLMLSWVGLLCWHFPKNFENLQQEMHVFPHLVLDAEYISIHRNALQFLFMV